ncbi:hypothetical protein MHB81_15175 [Paenibacillus sp. FSL H7-0326]
MRKPFLSKYERCRFSLNISLPPQVEPQVEAALPSQTRGERSKVRLGNSQAGLCVGTVHLTNVMNQAGLKELRALQERCKSVAGAVQGQYKSGKAAGGSCAAPVVNIPSIVLGQGWQ